MTMKMKFCVSYILIVSVCMGFVLSCSKNNSLGNPQKESTMSEPMEEFAVILSKAVFDSQDLRTFLKLEASKEFDKDYDVFYPFVKDKKVDGTHSFRDVLSCYDEKGILNTIESDCPLLNIHIPDWSWIGAFSINNWDVSKSDVSVMAYCKQKNAQRVYNNGQFEGSLLLGEIPGFPMLIVKTNERMKIDVTTKSGVSYSFIDDAFNGMRTKSDRGRDHEYYDRDIPTEDYSNFILQSEISRESGSVISAFNMFQHNRNAAHRDYIYYGMTNDIKNGKLNNRVTEYIKKFRFATLDSEFLFDGDDFTDSPKTYTNTTYDQDDILIKKMCLDGNLEIYFDIFVGNREGDVQQVRKFVSVPFADAFQLAKVHVDFMHKTWFESRKWVYTVDKSCFVPKWINANIRLPKWDISTQSSVMNIIVTEYDNEEKDTINKIIKTAYANNFMSEAEIGAGVPIGNANLTGKVKVGYNSSKEKESAISVQTEIRGGSDELGTALLYYSDPIITSSERNKDNANGYRIKDINTGFVHMMIIPRYE